MHRPDRSRITLSREEMRSFGYRVVDLLAEHFAEMEHGPVGAKVDPARIQKLFAAGPPEDGRGPRELLAQLQREGFPNNLHVHHPRFFPFVTGPDNLLRT